MTDNLTPAQRRYAMGRVKSEGTAPEVVVRRLVHRLGGRFRLHRRDLPGSPDLVLPARKLAIFVHGCFWHQHVCRRGRRAPATNVDYWRQKLARNRRRDREACRALRRAGWRVLVVWECQTKPARREWLERKLAELLDNC